MNIENKIKNIIALYEDEYADLICPDREKRVIIDYPGVQTVSHRDTIVKKIMALYTFDTESDEAKMRHAADPIVCPLCGGNIPEKSRIICGQMTRAETHICTDIAGHCGNHSGDATDTANGMHAEWPRSWKDTCRPEAQIIGNRHRNWINQILGVFGLAIVKFNSKT